MTTTEQTHREFRESMILKAATDLTKILRDCEEIAIKYKTPMMDKTSEMYIKFAMQDLAMDLRKLDMEQ